MFCHWNVLYMSHWCHQCVPFCVREHTVSRRHHKTWNLKHEWTEYIAVGSSGERAGGHAGGRLEGMLDLWRCEVVRVKLLLPGLWVHPHPDCPTVQAFPCLQEHQRRVPNDSRVAPPVWALRLKAASAFCSWKVSRSRRRRSCMVSVEKLGVFCVVVCFYFF